VEGIGKTHHVAIVKSEDDKQQVFGWASVAVRASGEEVVDWQEDIIEIGELEQAAYEYALNVRTAGEMHEGGGIVQLIESVVFTKEKAAAMGIPTETLPEGWWIGFHIFDDDVWEKVKTGEYSMFSIEGTAERIEI
jgi:hypothetical protein